VEEKNLNCVELRHAATGARHLHVDCDDSNNTFAVSFLTVPSDSTGVAHILEHTALCGSAKYPVRDPFFNMIKRSLNTFMNAFTGADYTMYPFSSQNAKDYANLLSIYLDASFFPILDRLDFLQEGHRLEFDAATGQLVRTGVVFNEMHGALSDSSSLFREQMNARLYPDTTYGVNSGGDPENIPELTWQGLREFHARHYSPENAVFYTYGDMPLAPHLQAIDASIGAVKRQRTSEPLTVRNQKLFSAPVEMRSTGPPQPGSDPIEEQHKAALVWLMPDMSTDQQFCLAMHVLSELLLSGPNAPLYRALLETRLGSGFTPMTGFEAYNKQPTFGVGLSDMTQEDAEKLTDIVLQVLRTCRKEGFPKERIESVLHQLELSNKHVTTSYGLNAGMSALLPWMHGGDPVDALRFDTFMSTLRKQIEAGYLQELIETRLLNNTHRLFARQTPDPAYTAELKAKERRKLDLLEQQLTQEQKEAIRADSLALQERQNAPPNVECLPTLSEADIPVSKPPVLVETHAQTRFSVQPTNGITYLNAIMDFSELPEHLVAALPMWCGLVTSQGAAGKNFRDFAQEIDLFTGGVSLSPVLSGHPEDARRFQMGVSLHSHCLDDNVEPMLSIVERLIQSPDWSDRENVAALLEQSASGVLQSLTQSGHSYAAKTAALVFGRQHRLSEQWGGMTQVSYMSELAKDPEAVLDRLLRDFAAIEEFLRTSVKNVRVQVNSLGGEAGKTLVGKRFGSLWGPGVLDSSRFVFTKDDHSPPPVPQQLFFPVPSQVNFVARSSATGVTYSHPDMAALSVGAKVLSSCFLHREIREKGGAYGSGCSASEGVLTMTSYRDPQLTRTLATFDQGLNWLFQPAAFSDRDVREAKLSLFSALDKPVPPGSRGLGEFSSSVTHAMREKHRQALLAVDRSAILNAFSNHVLPGAVGDGAVVSIAALGNDQLELDNSWSKRKI
jgi:Zn-dependent M16 (insulinase) family peptidase